MSSTVRWRRFAVGALASSVIVATTVGPATPAEALAAPTISVVDYNSATLAQYNQKWTNIYGPLDGAAETVSDDGITVNDVPFKPGTDYSVFDHLKYMAVSNRVFPAPSQGSVTFSVDISASTPGAVAGHVVHGQYGPPGSFGTDPQAKPYSAAVLEGQQAAVVLNMVDFCSGQLFDWFISRHSAFPLIERLPSSITGNTTNPNCPGATTVDLSKAYTQIIKVVPVAAGVKHRTSITLIQAAHGTDVAYTLDGRIVAVIHDVGIPLDRQGIGYTGLYPSLGQGEPLGGKIKSVQIGHGLFSLLDAFPFQYGCTPPITTGPGICDPATAAYSVSIPASQRSFGQGATGTFNAFQVITLDTGKS